MKFNQWTLGLAAVGAVSLASAARADEKMAQVQTALSNTTISGYVDTAISWRPNTDRRPDTGNGGVGNVPAYSFAKNDGFSLNAIDIAIDHPLDESPWAAGYHVELMAGPDAVPANNQVPYGAGSSALQLGFAGLRQAYVALRTPLGNSGIDWKLGLWDTIIGYESTSTPLDPNYTRSYGYSIEPTTHSGLIGTYKVNDMFSMTLGVANSWFSDEPGWPNNPAALNSGSAYESQRAYLGAVAFTAPESWGWLKGGTFNAGVVHNVGSTTSGTKNTRTSWYLGSTIPTPITALKVGGAFDLQSVKNGSGGSGSDYIWVAGLYAAYQINDKASLNFRGEYVKDGGNTLVGNVVFDSNSYNSDAEEFTATLQYNLWANVISRLEFRWDHVEHGVAFGSAAGSGNVNRNNDFLLALNVIYQF